MSEKNPSLSRRELEEKLEECAVRLERTNKEFENFLHILSHDLKEPLYTISMYSTLLVSNAENQLDPEMKQMIGVLNKMSQQSMKMIDGLVKYSRLKAKPSTLQTCDLEKISDNAASNYKSALISRTSLPSVMGDPEQLAILFQALLDNAVKFHGKEKSEIKISAKKKENEWLVSVSDNGIGIEKNYFDRIFQMFQRLHPRSEFEGAGMGLTLCKAAVDNHGGKIWVDSEPGKGSTFFFTLPQK